MPSTATAARPSNRALFAREFLRSPLRTASLVPSSRALGARMVAGLPARGNPVVVELGPGTGAFTGAISASLGGRGRQLAVEVNERLAADLRPRHPGVEVITGSAGLLPELLAERGVGAVDAIVSGLPWTVYFDGPRPLAQALAEVLAPTGVLTQFSYPWTAWAPPARRQRAELRAAFEELLVTRTVWRNVPPALVYVARRPRSSASPAEPSPPSASVPVPAVASVASVR
ncbi:class I SAM-dependent methyltransferase [Streptomyces profundus]|uniref:class I SAM-dependent methyltransferase n=1 Tax=Streptomyces profundus TaxID=2867410 RepID=UPI001D16EA55|nr:SAM-dependent methyltransferase [Streptomyces sp. MA3_2.13]UED84121.1 SAM-dependent methyltransferase [Streptomyces sp. MA3_2.13]